MIYTIEFLKLNNFVETLENTYTNSKCEIEIIYANGEAKSYRVTTEAGSVYSTDMNIYWLIGILTYNGYIDRNFKKLD